MGVGHPVERSDRTDSLQRPGWLDSWFAERELCDIRGAMVFEAL